MLDPQEAQARCHDLLKRAASRGADAGDAVYHADASQSVTVRLGKLEDVSRSESEHISLRVFVGRRSASIGASDLGSDALDALAERAVSMARSAPEDPYAGLAPEESLLTGSAPDLDLYDQLESSPADLRATALETEEAARAVAGVTNSEGAGASAGEACFAIATTHGFSGGYRATSRGLSASVIAGEGSAMQRDYAYRTARFGSDLPPPGEIGREAGMRAIGRLSPGRLASGPMPVVFDPRVGGTLVGHLLGAISGSAIARKASFLLGKDGAQLFDSAVSLIEEPHRSRGLRSRPFDGEGLPTQDRAIIDRGQLTGWLMDSASARQLGLSPTGHAARAGNGAPSVSTGNLRIAAGTMSPGELMADIADGVYVFELIGQGVNPVTGDYSRGASGFHIVNGELAGPVTELTIAGNLIDMFAALTPANDVELIRGIDVPTLRVDGMTIAGD